MKKKEDILASDISSNILDNVVLRLDYSGILDIDNYVKRVNTYLVEKDYVMIEDTLNENEAKITNENEVPTVNEAIIQKSIDKEVVYRFTKSDGEASISISRFFIYLDLSYGMVTHKLKKKLETFEWLIEELEKEYKYIIFQRLGLRKINSVVIKPEKFSWCFETGIYGCIPIALRDSNQLDSVRCFWNNNFNWDDSRVNVTQFIADSIVENVKTQEKIDAYQVVLDIECYLREKNLVDFNIENTVDEMNKKIFEIFKVSLTQGFLNDLINKRHSRVLIGVNDNE